MKAEKGGLMKRCMAFLLVMLVLVISCSRVQEIIIEAEDMEPNDGIQHFIREQDHVRMNGAGEITGTVMFSFEGLALFLLRVKGEIGGGAYPTVLLKLDGEDVSSVNLESDDWHLLRLNAKVTEGQHEISLTYTNDYYAPPEDRNLLVDKIIISPAE